MKIFFDARMIEHSGIGRYIRCLISGLKKNNGIDLNILGNKSLIDKYFGTGNEVIDFNYPIYSTQEQAGFMHLRRIIGKEILHVPHYNIPVLANFNLVVTIHDLIHIIYPSGASKRFASLYMKFMIERVLRRAKKIICVSNSTKNYLEKTYEINNPDIKVIYEGVDEEFRKIEDKAYLDFVKDKYKLPNKYILYVGAIRRHKNIALLLESFSKLKERIPDVYLVLVGKLSHTFNLQKENVIYLGEIPDDKELCAIYNNASVFCNLSLHEGFNLTILEAQKSALPVVCSNISTHLEIGADSVLTVPANPSEGVVAALYNVLTDQSLRDNLTNSGLNNIKRFNWDKTAEDTLNVYKELI